MITNHANPGNSNQILTILQEAMIFNPVNVAAIANHRNPDDLAQMLISLQTVGILNQKNFDIISNHNHPDNLTQMLAGLQTAGLLNQENFNIIAYHNHSHNLTPMLGSLQDAKILNQMNLDAIVNNAKTLNLLWALNSLQDARILNQMNFDVIINHNNPYNLAESLHTLQTAGILTPENHSIITHHTCPCDFAKSLVILQKTEILTPENHTTVANHANPSDMARSLTILEEARIINQSNFNTIANHAIPSEVARLLAILQKAEILTPENRALVANYATPINLVKSLTFLQSHMLINHANLNAVANHINPMLLAKALSNLHHAGTLTPENSVLIANHAYPYNFTRLLTFLRQTRIFTSSNLHALAAPNHIALLTDEVIDTIWNRIPNHLLTQTHFRRLLITAEYANPMVGFRRIRDQIIGFNDTAQTGAKRLAASFNPKQSTHTASVHRSVSESVLRLQANYGSDLELTKKIEEIHAYVYSLDNTPSHQAAKRCITRITAPNYLFNDSSNISTQELVALAYVAIHDEAKRKDNSGTAISLEDAKALFIEGLYEIQRGYNLQSDQEEIDESICEGGTFNKLMEKLNGIHQDVNIDYITHEGAYFKFTILVQKHVKTYLQAIASPENASDYQQVRHLLDSINESENIQPIWENIKADIQTELWDEFKEAYNCHQTDSRFVNMIHFGYECTIPNMDEIEDKLKTSLGYQEYLAMQQQSLLQANGLWANRHSSAQTQRDFDKQYGLTFKP